MNLKQLSDLLGLSQTTVSRALNGYPEVSEATRQKVQKAAHEHGYHPSTRAKGLATGQALAIGHVIPMYGKSEMVNPIFGDFIAGAGEIYSQNGYEMLLSVARDQTEEAIYRGLKARHSVDGVIVHGPQMDDPRIPLLQEIGLPFVVHGRASNVTSDYAWLDVNNKRAFERATALLCDLGHRRIALLNGFEHMDFAHRRRDGYVTALAERGLSVDPALMRSDEMTEDMGYAAAQQMLALGTPPTAFLTALMITAMGVRRAIEEAGLKMGRDVSIVTHDDALSYLQNGGDVPIYTATRSSVRHAGKQLAQMLIDQIRDPDARPEHCLLEAELVMGQSTGPAT